MTMFFIVRPPFGKLSLYPSLRANGSRECAPDDRLREAIQSMGTTFNHGRSRYRRPAPSLAPAFSILTVVSSSDSPA
jgi:hypothetical protein